MGWPLDWILAQFLDSSISSDYYPLFLAHSKCTEFGTFSSVKNRTRCLGSGENLCLWNVEYLLSINYAVDVPKIEEILRN